MANRFLHIDALRGIAALLVIWLHVSEVFVRLSPETSAQGTAFYDLAWAVDVGRIGVVIFFAISGFVICRSLKGKRIEGSKKFIIRRLLRLYPAFWVSIPLGLFSMWWLFDKPFGWNIIAANMTMLPELLDEKPVIALYWTLETELAFYVLCWLLFLNRKLNNPLILFLMSTVLTCFFIVLKIYLISPEVRSSLKAMPYHLAIMFWGGFFRYWYDNKKALILLGTRKIQLQWLLYILTIIIWIPALSAFLQGSITQDSHLLRLGKSYTLGLSMFIIGNLGFKIKNRFMVWIGTISYSLYLIHPVVFYSLFWYLRNKAPYWLMTFHLSLYIVFTMVFSIVLSAVIYYLVEKPAIDYAHKLTR